MHCLYIFSYQTFIVISFFLDIAIPKNNLFCFRQLICVSRRCLILAIFLWCIISCIYIFLQTISLCFFPFSSSQWFYPSKADAALCYFFPHSTLQVNLMGLRISPKHLGMSHCYYPYDVRGAALRALDARCGFRGQTSATRHQQRLCHLFCSPQIHDQCPSRPMHFYGEIYEFFFDNVASTGEVLRGKNIRTLRSVRSRIHEIVDECAQDRRITFTLK